MLIDKIKFTKLKSPKDGLPEVEVASVMVTPELAAELLTRNVSNRRPKNKHIKELKSSVIRGEWELNAQPVIIDAKGDLLDGQNRLMAIVAAGDLCPEGGVPILIARGVDPKAFHTIDQHSPRTAKDTLFVADKKKLSKLYKDDPAAQEAFAGLVSNAVRMAWGVREQNRFVPTGKMTNRQVQMEKDFLSNKKNVSVTVEQAITEVVDANLHLGVQAHISLTTFGGLYLLMANDDHENAKAFLQEFAYDKNAKPGDGEQRPKIDVSPVIVKLQKFLRTNRTDKTYTRAQLPELVAAAWLAYKDDPDGKFNYTPTPQGDERFHIGGKLDPERTPDEEPELASEEEEAELVEV